MAWNGVCDKDDANESTFCMRAHFLWSIPIRGCYITWNEVRRERGISLYKVQAGERGGGVFQLNTSLEKAQIWCRPCYAIGRSVRRGLPLLAAIFVMLVACFQVFRCVRALSPSFVLSGNHFWLELLAHVVFARFFSKNKKKQRRSGKRLSFPQQIKITVSC